MTQLAFVNVDLRTTTHHDTGAAHALSAPTVEPQSDLPALFAALQPYLSTGDAVVKVARCKDYYGVALLQSGRVVVLSPRVPDWHGQLLPAPIEPIDPLRHEDRSRSRNTADLVSDVAAGETHVMLCTTAGRVFGCGYHNRHGQLGDGTVWEEVPEQDALVAEPPAGVPALSRPRWARWGDGDMQDTVHPSHRHPTSGAENDRMTHSHGNTPNGDAVLLRNVTHSPWPRLGAMAVACGAHHTLVLAQGGVAVYSCGRGEAGQLGQSSAVDHHTDREGDRTGHWMRRTAPGRGPAGWVRFCARFGAVPLFAGVPVCAIAAAGHHSFVLTVSGRLYGFGDNTCGQLGLGHTRQVWVPAPIAMPRPSRPPGREDDRHREDDARVEDDAERGGYDLPGEANPPPYRDPRAHYTTANRTDHRPRENSTSSNTTCPALGKRPAVCEHGCRHDDDDSHCTDTYDTPCGRERSASEVAAMRTWLRAPYDSAASVRYSRRTHRLGGRGVSPAQEYAISRVYAGLTSTVVCSWDGVWLSCGLVLSRGWPESRGRGGDGAERGGDDAAQEDANVARAVRSWDDAGVLHRPVCDRRTTYRFAVMSTCAQQRTLVAAIPSMAANQQQQCHRPAAAAAAEAEMRCYCYPHAVVMMKMSVSPSATHTASESSSSFSPASTYASASSSSVPSTYTSSSQSVSPSATWDAMLWVHGAGVCGNGVGEVEYVKVPGQKSGGGTRGDVVSVRSDCEGPLKKLGRLRWAARVGANGEADARCVLRVSHVHTVIPLESGILMW